MMHLDKAPSADKCNLALTLENTFSIGLCWEFKLNGQSPLDEGHNIFTFKPMSRNLFLEYVLDD